MNVLVTSDRKITVSLDAIVGSIRTFGHLGPAYEVLKVSAPEMGSNVMLRIRVIESGEELDYPLNDVLDDPLAR